MMRYRERRQWCKRQDLYDIESTYRKMSEWTEMTVISMEGIYLFIHVDGSRSL